MGACRPGWSISHMRKRSFEYDFPHVVGPAVETCRLSAVQACRLSFAGLKHQAACKGMNILKLQIDGAEW